MPFLGVAIVRQYERGVVFRLGKLRNVRDPGLRVMIPLADSMQRAMGAFIQTEADGARPEARLS